jgi:hypothetical protein
MRSPHCLLSFVAAFSCALSCLTAAQNTPIGPSAHAADAQSYEAQRPVSSAEVIIPGPRRSFLRMAGISQKASAEEIMPLLARNVYLQGYEGSILGGRPTEFLILLGRYVHQAQELTALAGPVGMIRVSSCDEAQPLLRILGYRLRQNCGQTNNSLVTADSERAFLTTDSGFPLLELEESLQRGAPFSYPYLGSRVPILFTERDWMKASKPRRRYVNNLVETLLYDPALARLYWALARSDAATSPELQRSVGLSKLLPVAPVLDFYGSHICIRSGRVLVPGGTSAESGWKDLVGASPDSPAQFVPRLLATDNGWLAAYFDALSRVSQSQQEHFTDTRRLTAFYQSFRAPDPNSGAAQSVFRPAPGLLLLLTRLRWDANGEPVVPGNLALWKDILRQTSDFKVVRDCGKRAAGWTRPDQLADAMFAFSRLDTDRGPLQIYLFLSELDSRRPPSQRPSPETLRLLASRFGDFSDQYLVFSEFPELDDASIAEFVNVADTVDKISNRTLRGNAMGIFQANVGLWQILARQGQIARADLNQSWQRVVTPFAKIATSAQLFDAGRNSLGSVLRAASEKNRLSEDEIVDLLAGPRQTDPQARQIHLEIANAIRSVLAAQRLVSLDTIMALGDGLNEVARGAIAGNSLLPLARELREFEMPRPIFTASERTEWAAALYNNRHTDLQMQTDLSKVLESRAPRDQLEEARGQLAPFLRDILVGLNYAYYEPPGAQILHNNPLFVRSHDFSGDTVTGMDRLWQAPQLFGEGSPAGGGAHLVGSLAGLPYVLAEAEQDFISPENVQALIGRELAPGLLTNAVLPRWWGVTRNELHAVALYQRAGEELLTASADNTELRQRVTAVLADHMLPQRVAWVEQALAAGQISDLLAQVTPADTFYLTAEVQRQFPDTDSWGTAGQELNRLSRRYPSEVSWERLSQDFGNPHPVLAQNYAREMLNVKPIPAFAGYSSRLRAESWDSNNLYWARLADEMGYPPAALNRLVPDLTHRMVEKIFATDFEDWPALLRALQETGDEFRHGRVAVLSPSASEPGHQEVKP